jgi:hypothetical protein
MLICQDDVYVYSETWRRNALEALSVRLSQQYITSTTYARGVGLERFKAALNICFLGGVARTTPWLARSVGGASLLERIEQFDPGAPKVLLVPGRHRQVMPNRDRSDVAVFYGHRLADFF